MESLGKTFEYKSPEDEIIFPYVMSNYIQGQTIVDVGCKRGKWLTYLKDLVPHHCFHLFDPIKAFTADINRIYKEVNCYNVALSDADRKNVKFYVDKEHLGHSGFARPDNAERIKEIFVNQNRLDRYRMGDIFIIKIDTEGHELPILRGAEETLQMKGPRLYFECYEPMCLRYSYSSKDLYNYLTEHGYKIMGIDNWKPMGRKTFEERSMSDNPMNHNFLAEKQ